MERQKTDLTRAITS